MLKKPLAVVFVLLATAAAPAARAGDAQNGKELHNGNCMECHSASVYTRADRRVKNIGGLSNQVQRCTLNLGLKWFDSEIEDVTAYLNNQYYKFK